MFGHQFYPTKNETIDLMVEGLDLRNRFALDPSAGSGAILDYLNKKKYFSKTNLTAIEIDPELTDMLHGKGYKVIGSNFLDYSGSRYINLILMNPPFDAGAEHVLHAWDVLTDGDLVALVNAETINNPHSHTKKMLANLIEQFGTVENIGDVFSDAKRKTKVDVCLIRLNKIKTECFDFGGSKNTECIDFSQPECTETGVASSDRMGAFMDAHQGALDAFKDMVIATKKLKFYASHITSKDGITSYIEKLKHSDPNESYNEFVDDLTQNTWTHIISTMGVEKYMTDKTRKDFQIHVQRNGSLEINPDNIRNIVAFFIQNGESILNGAVIEVFDIFTKYHEVNRIHPEGWKTNKGWFVNKKVILPNFCTNSHTGYYQYSNYCWQQYSDIDKVMCYLSGKNYDLMDKEIGEYSYSTPSRDKVYHMISIKEAISRIKIGSTEFGESEFFKIRCYKKGTCHLYFKSEELLNKFNIESCNGKNVLGW